jgi:DnaA family protein
MIMQQLPLGVRLQDRATFDSFVAGPNTQVLARLRSMTAGERAVVWVCGPSGSGRTHLLHAVCAAVPLALRVAYLPLATLPAGDGAAAALESAAEVDVLCLDDLDTVIGQPAAERALFSAYRRLEERQRSLLVSASQPPAALPWTLADIGSRFAASEVFVMHPLDEAAQHEALTRRAAGRGLDLPEDTARYLLRRSPRDMASLCRLLDDIDVASLSAQRRLTVPFVRALLDGT